VLLKELTFILSPMSASIVVTGAAGGLGPALVRFLVSRGDRVAAIGSPRSSERLQTLQQEFGSKCIGIAMDVNSPPDWEQALAQIDKQIGAPWGAALLAGGFQGGGLFHEADEAVWQKMFSVNLETARHSMRALLPGMVQRRVGSIVAVGSQVIERPWKGAGAAAYTAAKSAVVALARTVAAEVAKDNVRVNAILPGTIDTDANRAAMPKADKTGWVSPESLSEVIGFLLSGASRDVSGIALPVYGRAG
jgi:NAD(P)-dependent dehydrogenase (short-subunit alcohol dehydrogenase family)